MKKSYLLFILILSAFLVFSCSSNDNDEELADTDWHGPAQDDNNSDTLPDANTHDNDKTDTESTSDDETTDSMPEYDDTDDDSDNIDISDIDTSENDNNADSDDIIISDTDISENDDDDSTDQDTDSSDSQPDDDGDTAAPEPGFPQCSPTSEKPCISGKLIWSSFIKNSNTGDEKFSQGGSNTKCENLEEGGYSSGWRLPTINELRTLVQNCDKTVSLPEGVCQVSDDCVQTSCKEESKCKCSTGSNYSKLGDTVSLWSGTKVESNMSAAWYINFSNTYIDSTNTSEKKSARCVHEAN